ncbi:MAG: hypothetical protein ACYC8T_11270 [Myxococcaceae bacterium]
MGFIRFVLWTSFAVAVGIFVASFPLSGKTPLQHAERAWKHEGSPQLDSLIDQAKDVVAAGKDDKIRERHTPEDRDEVNRLISKRSTGK